MKRRATKWLKSTAGDEKLEQKLDDVIAGLAELRSNLAQHNDLVAKIAKEKEDLAAAKSIAFGLTNTIRERKSDLSELEKRIDAANAELRAIKEQIGERTQYRQTIQSEINGMRERLGL